MKSLTGISQGLEKCTKATLQKNYFCRKAPDDCFCLETWFRYHYNKKRLNSKIILIWRSSGKMNSVLTIIIKNVLILYYLWKKVSKFCDAQKKFSVLFLFSFVPQQVLNFFFYVSLCEINCIKIQTISLASESIYFSRDSLCFIYFDIIIHQRPKKKSKLVELFF